MGLRGRHCASFREARGEEAAAMKAEGGEGEKSWCCVGRGKTQDLGNVTEEELAGFGRGLVL